MEEVLEQASLARRAHWLVKLRWLAIAFLVGAVFVARRIFNIHLHEQALYILAGVILVYNAMLYVALRRTDRHTTEQMGTTLNRILFLQSSADLFFLTAILYFSGGIENPFSFYFMFHMIISSTLLSRVQSYMQATMAVVLFGLLLLLDYQGVITHYPLRGFAPEGLHTDGRFVLGYWFVFTTTVYLVVYLATSIVAQLRKQQARYRNANEQLQQKDLIKNEYVLRVTHDIKSHLAAIKSCLDVVGAGMLGPLNEKQAEFVERANHRAEKCMKFISSLLRLTRMRMTGHFDRTCFPFKNLLYDSFAAIEDRAVSKNITATYEIDPVIDQVCGSEVLLEDTLTNLLSNAVKYTPNGGTVTLRAKDQKHEVLVEISDTGIGIPPEEIGDVFNEFYRASNARETVRDGTGLGLSMAKEVVERHGGRIWIESSPDGTTFFLTIPKDSAVS
ncbi:MAG: HAMP domain-containing histidine kinase [Sedimentisphaerales bacterium]|nr:HAMP domain-containing histidine kinase [Sedimentisphaerales bacterium]